MVVSVDVQASGLPLADGDGDGVPLGDALGDGVEVVCGGGPDVTGRRFRGLAMTSTPTSTTAITAAAMAAIQ
jgi:hypothetical protein